MEITMLKQKLRHVFFLVCILLMVPAPALPDCHYSKGIVSPADISEVLFEVAGTFLEQEKKAFNKDEMKQGIKSKLKQAGINATIAERTEALKTETFIKIRIHSIMLERQVYLCSAEVIRRRPSQNDCSLIKHSNVTSLVKHTPPLINDLIDQLLRDIE